MAGKFALITHPYDLAHLRRILDYHEPGAKLPPDALLMRVFEWTPAFKLGEWHGVRSATGAAVDGYNIGCPVMPRMPTLGPRAVFAKVRDACRLAGELGADIAALGGFTSIYGENGHGSAIDEAPIAVTTGNTLTAAMAVRGIARAAETVGVDLAAATVAIVGATGDIGTGCARALAPRVGTLVLAARSRPKLERLARSLGDRARRRLRITRDNRDAVAAAHVVLCVASAAAPIVEPGDLRPGAIVCDVGYPKNVAARTAARDDVFVFDGGLVATPTPIDFGFDNGLPHAGVLYGCFAECVVLALAGRFESFSRGKGRITPEKMDEMAALADEHGFRLAPFYSGGRLVADEELAALRERMPDGP
ncbi:MAG: shikimate dehydrogenase [Candidatus Brocadiia bacterium]